MIVEREIPPRPQRVDRDEFIMKYHRSSTHFIERLKERYSIDLTISEYNNLLIHENRKYQGLFAKNSDISIGILIVNGINVWVLYNHRLKLFTTAYPPLIETDVRELIRACFSRPVRHIAYRLYEIIIHELNSERFDFTCDKDAAIHYFTNCKCPKLLIEKFKYGNVRPLQFCQQIKKIIEGTHRTVSISITKK